MIGSSIDSRRLLQIEVSPSTERRLIEAANTGDVDKFHNLINDYPLLLRAVALTGGDNPLHIACIMGHVRFVREVLNQRPEFTNELNQHGLSPLHIASAHGDIEIVKELLKLGRHLCLIQGKDNIIPLHLAVAKGRIEAINELLSACSDSIMQVTAGGETCFHLAVKNIQFKASKVLCEHVVSYDKAEILNRKDEQGNTILHLAASGKQYENKKGLTPLDVLISEGGDSEIEEMLTLAGALGGAVLPQNSVVDSQNPSNNESVQERRSDHPKSAYEKLQDYFKYDKIKDSPSKARNTLLVIAVLIVTATYQAVLSPPGGVWQDDFWPDSAKNKTSDDPSTKQPPRHTAGESVMGTTNSVACGLFLLFNSIGFFVSLRMMNFLTLGLPLQLDLRVALIALVVTYDTCMVAIAPTGTISRLFIAVSIVAPLMIPIVTKVVRDCKIGRPSELPSTTASA